MDNKKTLGFNVFDKNILEELPCKAIVHLTTLFNAILRVGYYPDLSQVSRTSREINKPGKPAHQRTSYIIY